MAEAQAVWRMPLAEMEIPTLTLRLVGSLLVPLLLLSEPLRLLTPLHCARAVFRRVAATFVLLPLTRRRRRRSSTMNDQTTLNSVGNGTLLLWTDPVRRAHTNRHTLLALNGHIGSNGSGFDSERPCRRRAAEKLQRFCWRQRKARHFSLLLLLSAAAVVRERGAGTASAEAGDLRERRGGRCGSHSSNVSRELPPQVEACSAFSLILLLGCILPDIIECQLMPESSRGGQRGELSQMVMMTLMMLVYTYGYEDSQEPSYTTVNSRSTILLIITTITAEKLLIEP